jgi:sacsin
VKNELSNTHPEILLFLSKIRQLSVREMNDDPKASKINQISISSEVEYKMRKDIDAESYTVHLAIQENGKGKEDECTYYMWKQKFAVKPECRVQKRTEVDRWVITLAFPHGQRLNNGARSPGVYAFLPTEMVTNLPFIIQADFLLASSRESILFDNKWNRGILDCVPSAFVNAFEALLKSSSNAPLFALPPILRFLPIQASPIMLFDSIRQSIKTKVTAEDIIPCESYTTEKVFCKPTEVSRLDRAFWRILNMSQKQGNNLQNLSSHGTFILSSYLDCQEYDDVLRFLGIGYANYGWYGKLIEGLNLVKEGPEEVYVELLSFIAENWQTKFSNTHMKHVPLLKCVSGNGSLSYYSVQHMSTASLCICLVSNVNDLSWLICWNKELSAASGLFFMPLTTQNSLNVRCRRNTMDWLRNVARLKFFSVYEYAVLVAKALHTRRLVLTYCHFLHHSHEKKYITDGSIRQLCNAMPVIDSNGCLIYERNSLLVPAKGSNWAALMVSNPWKAQKYIELSADYNCTGTYAGYCTPEGQLITLLRTYAKAIDLPFLRPPNASFPSASKPLTVENALLVTSGVD